MNQNPWHALMTWVDARIAEKLRDIGVYGTTIDAGHIGGLDGSHSHSMAIDALTDVDTTTVAPAMGDVLTWDGTNWIPGAASALVYVELLDSDGANLLDSDGAYLVEAL